jgi:hypothetical protein
MEKPSHKRRDTPPEVRRVTFLKDPRSVTRQAKKEGAVAITDSQGRARLLICIPTDVR